MLQLPFIILVTIGFLIVVLIIILLRSVHPQEYSSPSDIAGDEGEEYARSRIQKVLRPDDLLFSNIEVSCDGRETELDIVIVNHHGVFIIEVKNYSGKLSGNTDDYEWTKTHISRGGNAYVKAVKNPIRQVKREIYILAKYLEDHGVNAWVEGYIFMCDAESPVEDEHILLSLQDLDRRIHTTVKNGLSQAQVAAVANVL